VLLPLANPSAAATKPRTAPEPIAKPPDPTILVVDDDKLVRNLLVRTLEDDGYRVLAADSMATALELARRAADISLVVTDVVMPGGSGVDAAHALWIDRPGLPVIFVSGYTDNRIDGELLARSCVRFLAKPFDPDALLDLIAQALANATKLAD